MKNILKAGSFIFLVSLFSLFPSRGDAQILEIITAVIKAIDIKIQKLQNATITLQNIQKEVENELSKLKLDEIGQWVQKQKDLYAEYFDELWKVKEVIAYFKQITDIIEKQKQLVAEYKTAYALVQKDSHFSPDEVTYMYSVFSGIIDQSVTSVDRILLLLQSFTVQMPDAERLKLIDHSTEEIDKQLSDLRNFNNDNIQLSLQRSKDMDELNTVKKLYGLP
jgi:hypothetical protein